MEVYDLMKKSPGHQHPSCGNCHNKSATRYCKQCTKYFCQQCGLLHIHDQEKPDHAAHQIISLDRGLDDVARQLSLAEQSAVICGKHNEPVLKVFCEVCRDLVCHDCAQNKHNHGDGSIDHDWTIIQSHLTPLYQENFRLKEAKRTLMEIRNRISQQAERAKGEIANTIAQIKNRLDESGKKLTEDVDSASKQKLGVIDQQMKELDTVLGHVTECIGEVEQCIEVGTPHQLLLTKPQIISQTERVINSVQNKAFQPLELPDIEVVKKSDIIDQIHSCMKVKCSLFKLHPAMEVTCISYSEIPLVGKKSTIKISLPEISYASVPPTSIVKCHLIPPDKTPPIQCSVNESSTSGQYDAFFIPLSRGIHRLHVTVNGIDVRCSRANVFVSVPTIMRGDELIKTISNLRTPRGIAVNGMNGFMVVTESHRHCISIFNERAKRIKSFGAEGKERGLLKYPQGLAVTSRGTILVADSDNCRIQEFTMEGDCISCGDCPLKSNDLRGVAIKKTTGQVFVADRSNHRVLVFHPGLTFSHVIEKKMDNPYDVAFDSQGFMFVSACNNDCVRKFTPDGKFLFSFGTKMHHPTGITIDDDDMLYVNNDGSRYVTVYAAADGKYIRSIDKCREAKANFILFNGIAFDKGRLLVCCSSDNVIKEF